MTNTYTMTNEAHQELTGMLEDTVAQFCQDNMISGELSWLIAQTFATAKLEQFKGNCK